MRLLAAVLGLAITAAFLALPATAGDGEGPLPRLRIAPGGVTVSGISSGGYLAHHLHVALSSRISGAGIFAAGPYACAGGGYPWNLWRALAVCMDFDDGIPFLGPPTLAASLNRARAAARAGLIDDPVNLGDDRVFLFSGRRDSTVPPSVVEATRAFYASFMAQERLAMVTHIEAGHGMVTVDHGVACARTAPPYINDCDFDGAGALLRQLYGDLAPPARPEAIAPPRAFEQRPFMDGGVRHGLGPRGWIHVPPACEAGAECRLHVALHGCRQTEADVGDAFVTKAGYNRWAEANGIVILYPQAAAVRQSVLGIALTWPNPRGCWDWWGFTGPDHATRAGAQIRAIEKMIDQVTGSSPP